MPDPRGVIQRWDYSGPTPKLFHRTRNTALFTTEEWSWSENARDAWVFDTFNDPKGTVESDAQKHVDDLKAKRVEHVYPVVVTDDPARRAERERRHADRIAQTMRSIPHISPQRAFEINEREGLA